MDIMDMLSKLSLGKDGIDGVARETGLENTQVADALKHVIPSILERLNMNAEDESKRAGLEAAVMEHADDAPFSTGSVEEKQADGEKILTHLFGSSKEDVEKEVSQKSNLSDSAVKKIMAMAAPLVMSYVGKMFKGSDNKSLNEVTQKAKSGFSAGNLLGMAKGFLDKDGDGEIMDDVMNMFKR